jgi:tetratricopeptide (TPR) repeat protein
MIRARELEPLSPVIAHGVAFIFIARHRYAAAIDLTLQAIAGAPDYPMLRLCLGLAYEQESRYEEAITEFEKVLQLLEGDPFAVGSLAHAHALAGNEPEALRMLHDLVERKHVDAYQVALVYVALGQQDQALEWLDKSCNNHALWFSYGANGDPRWDGLRSDSRFQNMLRRARFADAVRP